LKNWMQVLAIFAVGLALGAFAHAWLSAPPKSATGQEWLNAYNEEKVQEMMLQYQRKLRELESADAANTDELAKRVAVQSAILDLITKYRDAEFAKYSPFTNPAVALFAAILAFWASALLAKRRSETSS